MLWKNGNSGCIYGGELSYFEGILLSVVWVKGVDIKVWEMMNTAMNQTFTFPVHRVW